MIVDPDDIVHELASYGIDPIPGSLEISQYPRDQVLEFLNTEYTHPLNHHEYVRPDTENMNGKNISHIQYSRLMEMSQLAQTGVVEEISSPRKKTEEPPYNFGFPASFLFYLLGLSEDQLYYEYILRLEKTKKGDGHKFRW